MEAGNPDSEHDQRRPLYCRAEACPVDGFLGVFLANGGCIFCKGGLCSASPMTFSLFSTPANTSTRPDTSAQTTASCQTGTRPLHDTP